MSSLWTPDGERPLRREQPAPPTAPPQPAGGRPADPLAGGEPTEEELARELAAMEAEVLSAPAAEIVANHAYGLFQLASIHLSQPAPRLDQAAVAIDAMGCLVDGLGDRLGDAGPTLADGLAQLRMAFVQIKAAVEAADGPARD